MLVCICCALLAGETGLGKTTFVYNLVSGFKVLQPGRAHLSETTTMTQFKSDPNSLRTVLAPLEMPDSGNRLIITIQVGPVHTALQQHLQLINVSLNVLNSLRGCLWAYCSCSDCWCRALR